jgi:REP element-mobilizing transposase RayT
LFLGTIGRMSERFDNDIFAYVLMDNHYHLLLRTPKANLSRSMQWLGTTYTRRFNLEHFQSGHLFQGRYKSILVENDAYLMQLSYYIHNNPLRAGIVKRLIDYRCGKNWDVRLFDFRQFFFVNLSSTSHFFPRPLSFPLYVSLNGEYFKAR